MKRYYIHIASSTGGCFWWKGGEGDPSRTLNIDAATFYENRKAAYLKRQQLSGEYPNRKFTVYPVET